MQRHMRVVRAHGSGRRATASRALTLALGVAAIGLVVLSVLYLVRPAASMPGLIPGLTPKPDAPHRYRMAVASLTFALIFGYIALLRRRLERRAGAADLLTVPRQPRSRSPLRDRGRERLQHRDDTDRPVHHDVGAGR